MYTNTSGDPWSLRPSPPSFWFVLSFGPTARILAIRLRSNSRASSRKGQRSNHKTRMSKSEKRKMRNYQTRAGLKIWKYWSFEHRMTTANRIATTVKTAVCEHSARKTTKRKAGRTFASNQPDQPTSPPAAGTKLSLQLFCTQKCHCGSDDAGTSWFPLCGRAGHVSLPAWVSMA